MKVLYFRPRNDDDPPPEPAGRRRRGRDTQTDVDQASRLIVLNRLADSRSLPQAA